MIKELNKINFNDLLILDTDIDNYNFNVYIENKKHLIKGFCTRCEENKYNICPSDSNFKLQNISHGATSNDVLLATDENNTNSNDWKNEGVMFLMEGPSVDSEFYETIEFNNCQKKPTKDWYWIHKKGKKYSYPQEFRGSTYDSLFNSIIFTFKLKNAYLTNLVKCGLNNSQGKYKGITEYNEKCIETCVQNILSKEIEIIKPKIIFCFGSNVEKYFRDLYKPNNSVLIIGLPHPAGQQRGFKNEYYRHLYYTRILEGLYKAEIYSIDEALNSFHIFLTKK